MKKYLVLLIAVMLLLSVAMAAEARTSASYGYFKGMYNTGGVWYAQFDLLSFSMESGYSTNVASQSNDSTEIYTYPIQKNCMLYTCDSGRTVRCYTPEAFLRHVGLGSTCYVIYLNDEIVLIADAF